MKFDLHMFHAFYAFCSFHGLKLILNELVGCCCSYCAYFAFYVFYALGVLCVEFYFPYCTGNSEPVWAKVFAEYLRCRWYRRVVAS